MILADRDYPILVVRWRDATNYNTGWEEIEEIETGLAEIISCGHLVTEDAESITLFQSYCARAKQVTNDICIPKSCIVDQVVVPIMGGVVTGNA